MANPSTTGPSGIGSEVLRRTATEAASSVTTTILTVGTDMIVTILSVIYTQHEDTGGAVFELYMRPDGAGTVYLVRNVTVAYYGSYFFDKKVVLTEGDQLKLWSNSTDYDIYCSYIEQEFE